MTFLSPYLFIVTQCETGLNAHKAEVLGGKQAPIPFKAHSLHIGLLFYVFRAIRRNWIHFCGIHVIISQCTSG